jgi:hypothetical protein
MAELVEQWFRVQSCVGVGRADTPGATGFMQVGNRVNPGSIEFFGASGSVGWGAPATASGPVYQMPSQDGTSGQALVTDGAGVTSWGSATDSVARVTNLYFVLGDAVTAPSQHTTIALPVDFGGTLSKWTLVADATGSAVVSVRKSTYAGFLNSSSSDSITASATPLLSSARENQDTTLTGWTTSFAAGDIFVASLQSVTTCKQLTLTLKATKT